MFERVKAKGVLSPNYSQSRIMKSLNDADKDIAATSLLVSLLCPVGRVRMRAPCRSMKCTHLQCFDCLIFLQMNEMKESWRCPICANKILLEDLLLDGYFLNVVSHSAVETKEVYLNEDGSWTQKEIEDSENDEVIDCDDENENQEKKSNNKPMTTPGEKFLPL
jgi:hypothetical protein